MIPQKCDCGGKVIISRVRGLPDWGWCFRCNKQYYEKDKDNPKNLTERYINNKDK